MRLGRHLGDGVAEPRGILENDLGEHREEVVAGERALPRDQLEQHHAERELIGLRGDAIFSARLAAHEVHVGRLHVAMDDARQVERVEPERRLLRHGERLGDGEPLPPL